ncbi:MAG: alpha/beta fold hydrolase [Acidithiobacillus sp.]|nr:alpha/beta fold hydrolase [Acidithiobacillus sp.]
MLDTNLLPLHWPEGFWQRPAASPEAPILVLFHGLGSHWPDMQALAEALDPEGDLHLIALDAPQRPVSVNRGYVMPAWYDIYGFGPDSEEDSAGLAQISERLQALLLPVLSGRTLLLGGFSQGAALALYLGVRELLPTQVILSFSGYLPLRQQTPVAGPKAPVIFWAHGIADEILPVQFAIWGEEILQQRGFHVLRKDYPMGHGIIVPEVEDARRFLDQYIFRKH